MDKKVMLSVLTTGALVLASGVTALAATETTHHTVQHHTTHHSSSKVTKHSIVTNHNTGNKTPSRKVNKGHLTPKVNVISDGTYTDNFSAFGVPAHGTAKVIDNGTQLIGTDYVVFEGKHYSVTFDQNLSGYTVTGGTYTAKSQTGTTKTGTLNGIKVPVERNGNRLTPSMSFFTAVDILKQILKQ